MGENKEEVPQMFAQAAEDCKDEQAPPLPTKQPLEDVASPPEYCLEGGNCEPAEDCTTVDVDYCQDKKPECKKRCKRVRCCVLSALAFILVTMVAYHVGKRHGMFHGFMIGRFSESGCGNRGERSCQFSHHGQQYQQRTCGTTVEVVEIVIEEENAPEEEHTNFISAFREGLDIIETYRENVMEPMVDRVCLMLQDPSPALTENYAEMVDQYMQQNEGMMIHPNATMAINVEAVTMAQETEEMFREMLGEMCANEELRQLVVTGEFSEENCEQLIKLVLPVPNEDGNGVQGVLKEICVNWV